MIKRILPKRIKKGMTWVSERGDRERIIRLTRHNNGACSIYTTRRHLGLFYGPNSRIKVESGMPKVVLKRKIRRNAGGGVDSSAAKSNTSSKGGAMATVKTKPKGKASTAKSGSKTASKSGGGRGRKSPLDDLTAKQREVLARRVKTAREKGTSWDGPEGICATIPGVTSAPIGRKLLQEIGAGGMIREVNRNGTGKKSAAKKAGAKGKGKVTVKRGSGRKAANPS